MNESSAPTVDGFQKVPGLATVTIIEAEQLKDPSVDLLGAAHRCDRCGARAYFRATHSTNFELATLLLCAHHGRKAETQLIAQGFNVQDQSAQLKLGIVPKSFD